MVECPACAGPAEVRVSCATCNGNMEVTQEAFDAFVIEKEHQEKVFDFWNKVQEYMFQDGSFTFEANGETFILEDPSQSSDLEDELPPL